MLTLHEKNQRTGVQVTEFGESRCIYLFSTFKPLTKARLWHFGVRQQSKIFVFLKETKQFEKKTSADKLPFRKTLNKTCESVKLQGEIHKVKCSSKWWQGNRRIPALIVSTPQQSGRINKCSTHYDSLDPWHVLLREQVLLEPFEVVVSPGHMVFSSASQL